jgi:hypothetical protein
VEVGHAGDVELGGLAVAMVYRYDDDEPGSPWRLVLHVHQRATPTQHEALAAIFLGKLGGDHLTALPWVRKACNVVGVRSCRATGSTTSSAARVRSSPTSTTAPPSPTPAD